ncbi:hypothetical protein BDD12DRAFT_918511 [Trichophaea hybrida]|nr:hypothetical protein BDD12DRAFT_918511 [Trichophaea hybrida]
MDMSRFQNFGKTITSSITPFAARTTQFMRETLGQADDKTQLPSDYLELEKRVDALKQVHQQLLAITTQYEQEKYALACEQVGETRIQQDQQIASRFNAAFNTTLSTNINFAQKARKNVENARLTLDAAKSKAKNGGLGFAPIAGRKENLDEEHLTEEQRAEIETAEDEFVGCTEEAVGVMKNVLDTPEPLRNLADLVQAQLEFHKKAFEIYSELAPLIDSLQVEQEASYRKSRDEGA